VNPMRSMHYTLCMELQSIANSIPLFFSERRSERVDSFAGAFVFAIMWFARRLCVIYKNHTHALGQMFGFEAVFF